MREPLKKSSESSDLRCSADTLYAVLCSPEGYREWYGWPKHVPLDSAEPGFEAGARLRFRGDSSPKTVTAVVQGRLLTFSDDTAEETFSIEPTVTGCRVSYTVSVYEMQGDRFANLRGRILATLRDLKEYTYQKESVREAAPEPASRKKGRERKWESFLAYFFRGYTRPTRGSEIVYGETTTEAAPRPSGRRLLIGAALLAVLLAVVSFSQGFQDSDIIPSSGKSVRESRQINKVTAMRLPIGVGRDDTEVAISCQGTLESDTTYVYYSEDKYGENGHARILYIEYDTSWETRAVGYLDSAMADAKFSGKYVNLDGLSPYGTVEDIEEAVGCASTAFVRDKSGMITAYFGPMPEGASLMSSDFRTDLVVTLDPSADVSYYYYYGPSFGDNPEPESLTIQQLRQASTVSEYVDQRCAYERSLILTGLRVKQAEAILNTAAVRLEDNEGAGTRVYRFDCVSRTPGCNATYTYTVETFEGTIVAVRFVNNWLAEASRDALGDPSGYAIASARTIRDLERELGILPSAAEVDENSVILRYGIAAFNDKDNTAQYPLSVKLWKGTMTVLAYSISEADAGSE